MATMAFNFTIAIFLALAHFGSTSAEIFVDFVDPNGNKMQTLRIVPIERSRGTFNMLYKSNGEWVSNAQLTAVSQDKHIYQFGLPGEGHPVDLSKVIKDLSRVLDRTTEDLEFEAVIEGEKGHFRMTHSGDAVVILDTDTKQVFILHAGSSK